MNGKLLNATVLLVTGMAAGAGTAQADTVIKCVDEKGQTTFTQGRCPAGQSLVEQLELDSPRPSGTGPATLMAPPIPPVSEPAPDTTTSQAPARVTGDPVPSRPVAPPQDYDPPAMGIERSYEYPYSYPYYGNPHYPRHYPPRLPGRGEPDDRHPDRDRPSTGRPRDPEPERPRPSVTERGQEAIRQKHQEIDAQREARQKALEDR
ncbi:protein of unknown function (DUF4124) [Pseudomonas duriflava]|uniref:DUF4124 domain-containing protein n=1 Tax=Pseudomonas duriflava TaxID=459528 RepID=A0A562QML4_9PSED|nr:DUF4124 domain-containing protein [Pseudomonas duriflava]TWI57440.1 protein of unknown function (DUF4124) [Pseudomonas duriflava]